MEEGPGVNLVSVNSKREMAFLASTIVTTLQELGTPYNREQGSTWWVGTSKPDQDYDDYESSGPDPIYWEDGTGNERFGLFLTKQT